MELQETQQYQGANEVSWEGGRVGFHSLDMVYDYEGKVVTWEELECYAPHIWKASQSFHLQENQENSYEQSQETKEFKQNFKERWGILYGSSFGDFHCSVPLGQDGLSGSFPFSWTSQAEMVRWAWAKEDAQSQARVSQEHGSQIRFCVDRGQEVIYVCYIVCLQSLAVAQAKPFQ